MRQPRSRAVVIAERVVLVALGCAFYLVMTGSPRPPPREETPAHRLALLQRQIDVLAQQPSAACPGEYGALATEKDLRIAMFYGYANFEDVVLDSSFANAMAAALELPCKGSMAACGFQLVRREPNALELHRDADGRSATVDVYWTAVSTEGEYNRASGARKQKARSREIKDLFYRALHDSDVVLFTGHSRGGGGLGFDPSTRLDIAFDMLFRSPAKAIRRALEVRPSRLKLLSAMSCESDKYYEKEFGAANPKASLMLVDGNISSNQTDQINIGILNDVLGARCDAEVKQSFRPVDDPNTVKVTWVQRH
jgi:hypothetical protein